MPLSSTTVLAFCKACASGVSAFKGSLDNDDAAVAANTAAAFQVLIVGLLKDFASDSVKSMLKLNPTDPLESAVAALSVLECINGFGSPDKGAVLKDAAPSSFDAAIFALKAAEPEEYRWSGDAALAYREMNKKLQQCLEALKKADKDLAGYVKSEAALVLELRQKYTYTKTALLAAIPVAWAVYATALAYYSTIFFLEPTGPMLAAKATATKFQYGIIAGAIGELAYFTGVFMNEKVPENSAAMRSAVVGQYDAARALVPRPTTNAPRQSVRASGSPAVSSFQHLSGELSGAGGNVAGGSSRSYPVAGAKPYPVAGARSYPVAGAGSYPVAGATVESAPPTAQPDPALPPASGAPSAPIAPLTPAQLAAAKSLAQNVGQTVQSAVSQATGALKQTTPPTAGGFATGAGTDAAERAPVDVGVEGSASERAATEQQLER